MLTNLAQMEDVNEALRAGAMAYFIKSELKGNQLAERVLEILDAEQQR
jgi:CheY-like chemotaxis protein